jgi:hypothetical protein
MLSPLPFNFVHLAGQCHWINAGVCILHGLLYNFWSNAETEINQVVSDQAGKKVLSNPIYQGDS